MNTPSRYSQAIDPEMRDRFSKERARNELRARNDERKLIVELLKLPTFRAWWAREMVRGRYFARSRMDEYEQGRRDEVSAITDRFIGLGGEHGELLMQEAVKSYVAFRQSSYDETEQRIKKDAE